MGAKEPGRGPHWETWCHQLSPQQALPGLSVQDGVGAEEEEEGNGEGSAAASPLHAVQRGLSSGV